MPLVGPSEMHNRDLVLALSDDIVVRQRLGNHAPWPARQSMPGSDFSPQFRSPATTSMGTTSRRLGERHVPWRERRAANPGPPTNVAWAERWALLGNLERRERGPDPQPPCAGRPRHTV